MKFELTAEQSSKVSEWSKEQDQRTAERQNRQSPYYGAIGGALTYSFTPTSLGLVIQVSHAVTGQTLDLTDYHNW